MRRALYFPHTEVRSEKIVRTALLTWDALEFIVPYRGYAARYDDPAMARALEMIGEPRVVSDQERVIVHEMVEDMLSKGVPDIFKYSSCDGQRYPEYELGPQKMEPGTWHLLGEHGLIGAPLLNADFPTSQAAGLALMAILADVLAGTTRARITDRSIAYAAIANAMNTELQAPDLVDVVPLTFKSISLDNIPLSKLIELREAEAKDMTGDFTAMRHNYLDAVDKHVVNLAGAALQSDRDQLSREFATTMDRDFHELKRRLGYESSQVWLSAGALTLVATGATVVATALNGPMMLPDVTSATGAAVFIGGLFQVGSKYANARRDLMLKHPMAYLLQLQKNVR